MTTNEKRELSTLRKRLAIAGGLRSALHPADRARLEALETIATIAENAHNATTAQHIALGLR